MIRVVRDGLVSTPVMPILRLRRYVNAVVIRVMAMVLMVPILGKRQAGRHCDQRDADPKEFSFHA